MSTFELLLHGFSVALSPTNIFAAIVGVVLGTVAGVLPGLGISGTIALLLPISFGLEPLTALVIFAGIYYGAMYGGSTTAILINVPGEGPSIVTCIDGYAMTKKGRAGAALAVAAIGSFIAGTVGLVGLAFFAPIIADSALAFGPPEYFALAVLALVVLAGIGSQSMIRSGLMVCIGVMLSTVGMDPMGGIQRFTLGTDALLAGIDFVIVVMGAYGLGEVIETISSNQRIPRPPRIPWRELYLTKEETRRSIPAIARGSVIGFLIGLIPGPSASISSFLSYSVERRVSRRAAEFGKGAIEGVAGPESANNAAESATLIPLLSLGLPFSSSAAMLLSGFLIHGIAPGPMLVSSHPDLFWGLVASMFIGNVFLLIVNLPLIGIFVSILRVPLNILMPLVAVVVMISAYGLSNSVFDVWLVAFFGVFGFVMRLAKFNIIPLVIGLFLGPLVERGLIQSMVLVDGNFVSLLMRPLSGIMLGLAVLVIVVKMITALVKFKTTIPSEA